MLIIQFRNCFLSHLHSKTLSIKNCIYIYISIYLNQLFCVDVKHGILLWGSNVSHIRKYLGKCLNLRRMKGIQNGEIGNSVVRVVMSRTECSDGLDM
jgi:hypothetical protein